jgi:hypothetical protein
MSTCNNCLLCHKYKAVKASKDLPLFSNGTWQTILLPPRQLRVHAHIYAQRVKNSKQIAVRRVGRPRLRWEDDVRVDMGKMKIQDWRMMAVDREAWKRIVERSET